MMNILLFEKDASFAALLSSELSATGYICTSVRTAVELFHRMSLVPFRLVLINIAQAAAGRKEFWVALQDRQDNSILQAMTYRCHNLAGYTIDDTDAHEYHPDLDVDMRNIDMLYLLVQKVQQVLSQNISTSHSFPQSPVSYSPENEHVTYKLHALPYAGAKELTVTTPLPSVDHWTMSPPGGTSSILSAPSIRHESKLQRDNTSFYSMQSNASVRDHRFSPVGEILPSTANNLATDTSIYQATPSTAHRENTIQSPLASKMEMFSAQEYSLTSVLLTQGMISPLHMETASTMQQTLQQASMQYRLIDILLLFKFIDYQRLLLALLLARGVLSAQQLRACMRMREELAAVGQDYTLEQLLVTLHFATTQDIEAAATYLSMNSSI